MRVGTHAAVSATVDLAAATVGRRVTGLVNAVLRRVAAHDLRRAGWSGSAPTSTRSTDSRSRTPTRAGSWTRTPTCCPRTSSSRRCAADNVSPVVTLVVRPGLAERRSWRPGPTDPAGSRRSRPAGTATRPTSPSSGTGRAGVQDEGSQLVRLGRSPGRRRRPGWWLDLSRGPGRQDRAAHRARRRRTAAGYSPASSPRTGPSWSRARPAPTRPAPTGGRRRGRDPPAVARGNVHPRACRRPVHRAGGAAPAARGALAARPGRRRGAAHAATGAAGDRPRRRGAWRPGRVRHLLAAPARDQRRRARDAGAAGRRRRGVREPTSCPG